MALFIGHLENELCYKEACLRKIDSNSRPRLLKSNPTPASRGVEVSCTGGITEDKDWIRLFPMPYRFLRSDQRFSKYQWIEGMVTKASDPRPESYHIDRDSIKLVSDPLPTKNEWQSRKAIVYQLKKHCLCCIKKERDDKGFPTLGIFKPKIERLEIEPEDDPNWTQEQLEKFKQGDLLENAPTEELEKIPYKFRYAFACDHSDCPGHTAICTDWEMGESYRKWRKAYGDNWEAQFRHKYEVEMINKLDTHFYVGTIHGHPHVWIIVGLFYPPMPKTESNLNLFGS
jgi:hypothetical protein